MGPTKFSDRKKAMQWLQGQGFRISKSKIYRDTEAGLLGLEPDGSVTLEALERYIKLSDLSRPAEMSVQAAAKADRKAEAEIQQLTLKNERLQHEIDVMRGKYIEKTKAQADRADLAAWLDALPRHILMLNLTRYIAAIGADSTKARTVFELFDADFTQAVNQICDDGGVLIEGGDEQWPGGESSDDAEAI